MLGLHLSVRHHVPGIVHQADLGSARPDALEIALHVAQGTDHLDIRVQAHQDGLEMADCYFLDFQ